MEQNNNIKWTNNLEAYLKEVGEHSLCLSMVNHKAKYSHKALTLIYP